MEFVEFKGKTLDEALMQASVELGCASTDLEYNVVSEGSTGFLGLIGSKPFVISARKKKTFVDDVREYLETLFKAMDIQADIKIEFNETDNLLDIDVEGPEMGILIGKRGQTLDALQYLISLAVNKKSDSHIYDLILQITTKLHKRRFHRKIILGTDQIHDGFCL